MHGTKPTADPLEQPIVRDTWREKYAAPGEESYSDTCVRVINALYKNENSQHAHHALLAMMAREIVPAGRILAGAGTGKHVVWINCFVSDDIQDSMRTESGKPGFGIMDALARAAYTQQMGGGIGMNFSTIRPRGAKVFRTDSESSGVLPFMDMWDAMCATIRSSGSRRGAQMAVLGVWHPDVEEFVEAKQQRGRLTNFNVSVLVPDKFMKAVADEDWWDLRFPVPPANGAHMRIGQQSDGPSWQGGWVYKRVRARELWDKIIQSTYVHAEPGVIFIDRVNQLNNLAYCETISASNPCGEQMLPAAGCCNLGHTNLAVMVDEPFSECVSFNFDKLERSAATMVRLLDNVLDATLWPTEEQRQEAMNKRRIGLGFTGLASALQQLGVPYGSEEAVEFTREVAKRQAAAAYKASCELAKERGPFPLYQTDAFQKAPFVQKLPQKLKEQIGMHGIRNGVLLSVAPTGTTSLVVGNVSSGVEPVFAHRYRRKVRGDSGDMDSEYSVYDYGYLKFCKQYGLDPEDTQTTPKAFVTAEQLTVEQHLQMAAAAQEWVDSAISKTINCPTSMGVDEFRQVYTRAYELGMKGCTTYRPDPRSGRGAVLETESTEQKKTIKGLLPFTGFYPGEGDNHEDVTPARRAQKLDKEFIAAVNGGDLAGYVAKKWASSKEVHEHLGIGEEVMSVGGGSKNASEKTQFIATPSPSDKVPMQDVLEGRRYRIRWKHEDCAYYVQINNYVDGLGRRRPFELFINTKSTRHTEWVTAFALMVTAIFRREVDPSFIVDELRSVFSAKGGDWIPIPGIKAGERRHVPSLVAAVGTKIEEHLVGLGMIEAEEPLVSGAAAQRELTIHAADMDMCERCGALAVKHESGCSTCMACGASDCG